MVNNSDTPGAFKSTPPDGWKPRTPATHDIELLRALDECETPDDKQAKKNKHGQAKTTGNKSSSISRRLLMSPDDIDLHHGNSTTSRQLFSPEKTINNKELSAAEPFEVATINAEREATGKVAAMCTADIYDEHGRIRNTYKAYQPKLAEFNLYCKTFYNTDQALTYQITKNKVESYLAYCYYREAEPRGRQKGGGTRGGVQLDYMKANKIIKVFQAAKVNERPMTTIDAPDDRCAPIVLKD